MNRGTKAQMVEFINKRCRVNGKKIPKKQLNQIEKEKLYDIKISYDNSNDMVIVTVLE